MVSDITKLSKTPAGHFKLETILFDLSRNISWIDKSIPIAIGDEKILEKLDMEIRDVFRGPLPYPKIDLATSPKIIADFEYDGKTISLPIETRKYDRLQDFLLPIVYKLLAKDGSSLTFFAKLLNKLFLNDTKTIKTKIIIPKEYLHLVPKKEIGVEILYTSPTPGPSISSKAKKIIPDDIDLLTPFTSDKLTEEKTKFIFVYTDIISPRLIGSKSIRVLKVIPITNNLHIKFQNIEYVPIEKSCFDSLSIMLLDNYGEKINFTSGTTPNFVCLHFRPKN